MQHKLRQEVRKFKQWSLSNGHVDDYDDWWGGVVGAAKVFILEVPVDLWSQDDCDDLLCAVANDCIEYIPELLLANPKKLLYLAEFSVKTTNPDAKWPLAAQLANVNAEREEAETLLLRFVQDENEYVSRRALLALSELGSSSIPELVQRAWDTGQEYQRIAALWALHNCAPELLPSYLAAAVEDGREHLLSNVAKLRG
jgi:hypothetical protein